MNPTDVREIVNHMLAVAPSLRRLILVSACLLMYSVVGTSTTNADIITMLTGRIGLAPVSLDIENVNAATNVNGVVHVVGQHQGQGARQLVNLQTGAVSQVELFDSILSGTGFGGNPEGKIVEVQHLNDGRVAYVGQSAGNDTTDQPTYWFHRDTPITVFAAGEQSSGEVRAISLDGTFVGTSGFVTAAFGDVENELFMALPGFDAFVARDITDDSTFILGDAFIWKHNDLSGYQAYSTSAFDFSQTNNDAPDWWGTAIDPTTDTAVFAGTFFDLNTFTERVGFWREDGSLIGTTESATFTDFEVIDGHLVAAVAGLDDSYLYAMTDFSSISMTEILGESMQVHALYSGSLGFVGTSAGGGMFIGSVTAVPEPSSLLLLATVGLTTVGFSRRRRLLITERSAQ
jgi:hypothetical protein